METLTNKKTRGTLKDKFIILFILIASVPILILGAISLQSIKNSHTKTLLSLKKQTAESATEIVASFFTTVIDTLSTNFDTLQENNVITDTSSWQQTYAEKFVKDNPAILHVSFINLQGKEIASYSKNNQKEIPLYLANYSLVEKALQGDLGISNVLNTLDGYKIIIVTPTRVNGKVFGAILAEVSLTPLITTLEKIKIQNSGYVLLFDKEGTLVSSKKTERNNFLSWNKLYSVELHSSSDNRYYSEVTNVPVSGLTVKIPKIDWTIVVEWPLNEADTIVTNFRNTILLTVFVSIIIVIILALILAKHLINPVKKLQNASQEIEKGNFENKVIITTNDELEELGDSFNTMANGLKRLEELKNEFVYVAAHELRAPVTAVKGYMELIFDGAGGTVSPELEKLLTPVKKSNERLVNLVNDLLKVARQEAGRLEIILSRTNIVNHIVSILEEVTPLAKKRNIELRYVKKEIPDIMINDGSFKEVIMNFVSNAIKYGNDNGFVEITHSVENNILYTTIKDNGRGMSPEDQKHLFEKFFRASDVKNSSIEGTGLGLFITKELVEKMNGTLSVQSVPGQGTTFTIGFKIVS